MSGNFHGSQKRRLGTPCRECMVHHLGLVCERGAELCEIEGTEGHAINY